MSILTRMGNDVIICAEFAVDFLVIISYSGSLSDEDAQKAEAMFKLCGFQVI